MTDGATLTTYNNEHFILKYNSSFLSVLIALYPKASWRMQIRAAPLTSKDIFEPVIYEWVSSDLISAFGGQISISNATLIAIAPQTDIQTLVGVYVYDIRLEDSISNAVIDLVQGTLNILIGTSRNTVLSVPIPTNIATVTISTPVTPIPDPLSTGGLANGIATLDNNGTLVISQVPLTRRQALQALLANGVSYPSLANYFVIVRNSISADESDNFNQAFNDPFWPIGGIIWNQVKTALSTALGSFSDVQLSALQTQAKDIVLGASSGAVLSAASPTLLSATQRQLRSWAASNGAPKYIYVIDQAVSADIADAVNVAWNHGNTMLQGDVLYLFIQTALGFSAEQMLAAITTMQGFPS